MFDVTVQPIGIEAINQNETTLQLVCVIGIIIGPNQAIPGGTIRIPLSKDNADQVIKLLQEEADKLTKPSDLVIAGAGDVDKIAGLDKKIKKIKGK
jgi:hypothetical protein